MGLLDGFEKLITEHGSATILRERIALAEDKYSTLETKVAELNRKKETLESNLEKASKEIDHLKKTLQSFQRDQGIIKLKEIEKQILKFLFETNQEFYASAIASQFNVKIGIAEYHLNNLLGSDFIGKLLNLMDDTRYCINQKGRAYIVENTQYG